MPFASEEERRFARAVAALAYGNPFLPERLEAERAALGAAFDPAATLWEVREERPGWPPSPNVERLGARVGALLERLRARLRRGGRVHPEDRALYEDLVVYWLYARAQPELYALARDSAAATRRVAGYGRFRAELGEWLGAGGDGAPAVGEAPHLFACFFQVRRAFYHIYAHLLGGSGPARQLRAAVWQSIFTHLINCT